MRGRNEVDAIRNGRTTLDFVVVGGGFEILGVGGQVEGVGG